jgi:phosphate transport system substrate-binding protein
VPPAPGQPPAPASFGSPNPPETQDTPRATGTDNGNCCEQPTAETVMGGQYAPLSRPLFIYVDRNELQRPEVAEFVRFYMENAAELIGEVGYVPMQPAQYQANLQQIPAAGGTQ